MKRNLVMMIVIVLVFGFAACGAPAETAEPVSTPEDQTAAQPATEPTEEPTPEPTPEPQEPTPEPTPEAPQMPQSREDVMNAMLINSQWTAGENAEQMAENEGGQFGFIEVKQPSEDGGSFLFASEEDGAYMPLNTRLKDFGGDGRMQQAFNMKFMPDPANNLSFTLMGMGEVVIHFEDDGAYCTYVQAVEKLPISDFTLEQGKWYNILLATDENAMLRVIAWEDGNYENQMFYERDLFIGADDIYESNWKVTIGFDPGCTLSVCDYGVFMFDEFTENPPLADGDMVG